MHHKKRLTINNINEPSVALNEDNLELLCSECHENEHRSDRTKMFSKKRYVVDRTTGEISPLNDDI